ncbi:hypothetical protein Y032_0271g900 [Ancylostoma ceylanicum]|nr:hypothetical protein Y032_0271g900 [Ancylostoma ceylanicum]
MLLSLHKMSACQLIALFCASSSLKGSTHGNPHFRGKSGLSAEILSWTQCRAWPFWCAPRQLTLLIWHTTSGLA